MTSNSAFGFSRTATVTNPEGNPNCFQEQRGLSYQESAGTVKQKKPKMHGLLDDHQELD